MADELTAVVQGAELKDRKTTSDYIADALRKAILTGALSDGAVLNQVATARRFGVSRVPVREAMRQLQAEGLISAEAHHQPVVRALSIESIAEICELRAIIEEYLVERSIPNVDDELLARLEELEDRMDHESEHQEWVKLNGQFHSLLYQASGATTAIELAQGLRGRIERYLSLWSRGAGVERSEEAGREHRLILALIRTKNVAGAKEEVRKHVMATLQRIRELYGQQSAVLNAAPQDTEGSTDGTIDRAPA